MHDPNPNGVPYRHRRLRVRHDDRQRLIQLILGTWTGRGALVADLDDDPVTAATAAGMGRRYYHPTGEELTHRRTGTGWADIVMFRWPRQPGNPYLLLAACRVLLQPHGRTVVIVTSPAPVRLGHLHALVGAAGNAGLRLTEHVTCTSDTGTGHESDAHTVLLVFAIGGDRR